MLRVLSWKEEGGKERKEGGGAEREEREGKGGFRLLGREEGYRFLGRARHEQFLLLEISWGCLEGLRRNEGRRRRRARERERLRPLVQLPSSLPSFSQPSSPPHLIFSQQPILIFAPFYSSPVPCVNSSFPLHFPFSLSSFDQTSATALPPPRPVPPPRTNQPIHAPRSPSSTPSSLLSFSELLSPKLTFRGFRFPGTCEQEKASSSSTPSPLETRSKRSPSSTSRSSE